MDRAKLMRQIAEKIEWRMGRTHNNQALLNDISELIPLEEEIVSKWLKDHGMHAVDDKE